ncbi:MAG TPA: type IV toxin-antitoxin system AbiEi family antitoxin [Galbitalea sp.]|jgi:hypothetical protein
MARLSPVLSIADFPRPELDALRLDGEIFRVDDCVAPIDELPAPQLRAAALALELPPRLIAEQRTAAWVWGALFDAPRPHEVCADISARARPTLTRLVAVREVVLQADDVVHFAGMSVTTPIRTAVDLARFAKAWGDAEVDIVRRLMSAGAFDARDCADAINQRRNLPGKRLALERIALCDPWNVTQERD